MSLHRQQKQTEFFNQSEWLELLFWFVCLLFPVVGIISFCIRYGNNRIGFPQNLSVAAYAVWCLVSFYVMACLMGWTEGGVYAQAIVVPIIVIPTATFVKVLLLVKNKRIKEISRRIDDAQLGARLVNTTLDPNVFFSNFDAIRSQLEELKDNYKISKYITGGTPTGDLDRLNQNYDATVAAFIVRAFSAIHNAMDDFSRSGSEIDSAYRNLRAGLDVNSHRLSQENLLLYKAKIDQYHMKRGIRNSVTAADAMTGLEFEAFAGHLLRCIGYGNVEVTKASGDQGVDIIAVKDGVRYAIQCKNYSSVLGNTPVQEVNAGKQFHNCHVGVVLTNSYFTKGAIELAEKTQTMLWDRDALKRMIEAAEPVAHS